jgi:predicted nucleic acid-binding protein
MKHIFIDTNVIIDFLTDRKPFSLEAAKLFNFALNKKITLYTSSVSYNNIYYILRQSLSHTATIKALTALEEWTETINVSKDVIRKSLKSDFKDFEDAIQYNCAQSISKIECIVTRNSKDFKTSSLPVFAPQEAVAIVKSTIA